MFPVFTEGGCMSLFKSVIVGALFSAVVGGSAVAETVYVHAGTLLDQPGEKPKLEQTLIITDGKITGIEAGYTAPNGAELIDLSDKFVMPGLFDMHVHIQDELGASNSKEQLRLSDEDVGMRAVMYARRTLEAGFTTVRHLGSRVPQQIFALKRAIDKGWVTGTRIIAGDGVHVPGNHGDVDGMSHALLKHFSPKTLCSGPYECRYKTREAVKYGADVIKITATGGVLSDTDTGTAIQMEMDEMQEIVSTAHKLGRKVAAHAHAADGINAALRAGVDSIEHGSYLDKESVKLFKKNGAYLVPTLLAGHTVAEMAKAGGLPSDDVREKALRVGVDIREAFSRAVKAGVNIAYGTDSGVSKHGDNAVEAELMVKAGMSPMQVLVSATTAAADLAGLDKELGSLEAGKVADIIAMDQSPLEDITALQHVTVVIKEGQLVKFDD